MAEGAYDGQQRTAVVSEPRENRTSAPKGVSAAFVK
jgi:hypothetical protein